MAALHLGSEGYSTDGVNGYVGIGTTNINKRLTIDGAGDAIGIQSNGTTKYHFGYLTNGFNLAETAVADGRLFVKDGGNVGINCTDPQVKLDVNDNSIRIRNSKTPSQSSATGTQGQIAWDSNYIYICIATNAWKRVALSSW